MPVCIGGINRKSCFQSWEGIPAAIKSIMSRQTSYLAWSVYVCESCIPYDLWCDQATHAALKKLFRYLIRIELKNTNQKKRLWAGLLKLTFLLCTLTAQYCIHFWFNLNTNICSFILPCSVLFISCLACTRSTKYGTVNFWLNLWSTRTKIYV